MINPSRRKLTKVTQPAFPSAIQMLTIALGKTITAARHAYLAEKIPGPDGPFHAIGEWTEEDAHALFKTTCQKLRKEVVDILKKIRTAFERQKHRAENDTPEVQEFRKELHELVAEARRILDVVVRKSLDQCKQHK